MTWPLVILGLQLTSSETFVLDSVVNALQNQYFFDQGNVSRLVWHFTGHVPKICQVIDQILQMKTNTVMTSPEKVSACMQFIKQGLSRGIPPNMAVVIDTHADHFSGFLQYGGGAMAPKAANVGELIETFTTKGVLELMAQASDMGRSSAPDLLLASGKEPWCDVSRSARGGWRGAILASCGPSVLSKHHFTFVSGLVSK
jgi:hypothetical protein